MLMPYLLRKYGVPVNEIATIVAISMTPSVWGFLWSPLADTGLKRQTWILLAAWGQGVMAAAAILGVHAAPWVLMALLFTMNALAAVLGSCCGALLTRMPVWLRAKSGAWYQGGNLGSSAIGGGLAIWLADHAALPVVAAITATAMVVPALAALWIREEAPVRRAVGPQLAVMLADLRDVFRAKRTWMGMAFFLSPVGTGAIGNLISGVGQEYHASGDVVLWVSGVGAGLLAALGCFGGGYLAGRMNRMLAYALTGGLMAIFGFYLGYGPPTAVTYAVGYSCYAVVSGIAYAVSTALLLDVIGHRKHAAASAYATLNATSNLPITFMTWLDGVGYKRWGATGLMATDAVANTVFGALLVLLAIFGTRWWNDTGDLKD